MHVFITVFVSAPVHQIHDLSMLGRESSARQSFVSITSFGIEDN